MHPLYLILVLMALGVAFRYALGLTQATLLIGRALASPAFLNVNKTGFQDAVTPPESSKWFFIEIALTVGIVAWLRFSLGWAYSLGGLAAFFFSGTVAGAALIPRPNSRHFVMRVFASMSRRYADYERDGDRQRARVMKELLDKFAAHYGDVVTKG
jgi:hypothetical protein